MLLVGAKVALFATRRRRRRRPFYDPWRQLAPSAGFAFATFYELYFLLNMQAFCCLDNRVIRGVGRRVWQRAVGVRGYLGVCFDVVGPQKNSNLMRAAGK